MSIKIWDILKTKTFTQSGLTLTATFINGLLGVIFFVIIARSLGPSSYGILAFTMVFITLVADVAALGTDTGLIRFIGKSAGSGVDKKFLKLGLEIKLITWLLILIAGWISIPLIAEVFFQKKELIFPLRLSLFGIGSSLLFSFTISALQAYQKFRSFSLILAGSNALRLVIVITLILLSAVSLRNILLTYITIPFLGFFVGLLILPKFFLTKGEWTIAKEFFHYNKWIAAIALTAATGSKLDTFLSTKFLSTADVGVYSVAVSLTSFIPQLFFALATVAAPKLSGFDTRGKAKVYLKKLQLLTLGLAVLGVLALPAGYFLIPVLYGDVYVKSITPFVVLLISQLLFLIALPSHQAIFYYFAKPKIMFFTSILETLTIATLGYILIQKFGIIGASLAVLAGNVIVFILPAIWVLYKFTGERDRND